MKRVEEQADILKDIKTTVKFLGSLREFVDMIIEKVTVLCLKNYDGIAEFIPDLQELIDMQSSRLSHS